MRVILAGALYVLIAATGTGQAVAQDTTMQASCKPKGPFETERFRSVEQLPDDRVIFRICAPEATVVSVTSVEVVPLNFGAGDNGLPMTKESTGLWSATTPQPLVASTYRYNFRIGGVKVPDPLATHFARDRVGVNSVLEVQGPRGAFQSYDKNVPHGIISEIVYWSKSLNTMRRAQVYTPPGYMNGTRRYPVLYLVHGAGDSDDSWTANGHANYILDNLIAAGKAKPMIIVMPFGHTPSRPGADLFANRDFGNDFTRELIPFVQSHFRTINTPGARAMAGLSMGGAHTLRFGLTRPDLFEYVGIFSMGLGFRGGEEEIRAFEQHNADALRRAARRMKLAYYAIGKEDFLYSTAAPTVALLRKYGIRPVYHESEGGHVWVNWRDYLADFAPRLFR